MYAHLKDKRSTNLVIYGHADDGQTSNNDLLLLAKRATESLLFENQSFEMVINQIIFKA